MTETPARYRHRTPEVDAIQWTGDNAEELRVFCSPFDFQMVDPEDRVEDPEQTAAVRESEHGTWRGLKPGDWVVKRGVDLHEVSAADFAKQYEAAVPSAPADRAELRDRIAEALEQADYRPDMRRGDLADAIMPVLPTSVDRAGVDAVRKLHSPASDWSWKPLGCQHDGEHDAPCRGCRGECWPCPTIRALDDEQPVPAAEVRRVADEVPQPETEAPYPPNTTWTIQTHRRGTWHRWLGDRDILDEAREDYDRNVANHGHEWAYRLVRAVTTFAVEAEHTPPAVGAQQPKEADDTAADALLASRCDACRHTLKRHANHGACTVVLCLCGTFQPPADEQPSKEA